MQPHWMIFLFMPGLARAMTCAQACRVCYTPETSAEQREVACSMCMECNGGRRSRKKACAEYSNCVNTYGNQGQECPPPPYCPVPQPAQPAQPTCAPSYAPTPTTCSTTTCAPTPTTSIRTIWEWFSKCKTVIVTAPPTPATRSTQVPVQVAPVCPPSCNPAQVAPVCPPSCNPAQVAPVCPPRCVPGPQIIEPPHYEPNSESIEIVVGISRKPKY